MRARGGRVSDMEGLLWDSAKQGEDIYLLASESSGTLLPVGLTLQSLFPYVPLACVRALPVSASLLPDKQLGSRLLRNLP